MDMSPWTANGVAGDTGQAGLALRPFHRQRSSASSWRPTQAHMASWPVDNAAGRASSGKSGPEPLPSKYGRGGKSGRDAAGGMFGPVTAGETLVVSTSGSKRSTLIVATGLGSSRARIVARIAVCLLPAGAGTGHVRRCWLSTVTYRECDTPGDDDSGASCSGFSAVCLRHAQAMPTLTGCRGSAEP